MTPSHRKRMLWFRIRRGLTAVLVPDLGGHDLISSEVSVILSRHCGSIRCESEEITRISNIPSHWLIASCFTRVSQGRREGGRSEACGSLSSRSGGTVERKPPKSNCLQWGGDCTALLYRSREHRTLREWRSRVRQLRCGRDESENQKIRSVLGVIAL